MSFRIAFSCSRASRYVSLLQARKGVAAVPAGGVPQVASQAVEVLLMQHLYRIGDARFLYLFL